MFNEELGYTGPTRNTAHIMEFLAKCERYGLEVTVDTSYGRVYKFKYEGVTIYEALGFATAVGFIVGWAARTEA